MRAPLPGRFLAAILAFAVLDLSAGPACRRSHPLREAPLRARLTLQVLPAEGTVEILPGTPITFEVDLTALEGAPPVDLGGAGQPWHARVHLVEGASRRPLGWATVVLNARSAVFSKGADSPERSDKSSDVATIDRDHVQRVVLAASPETMTAVAPGSYEVRAILAEESRQILESTPVSVVVRGASEAPHREELERQKVADSAEFYLEAGRFADARRLAEELTAREPRNAGAWMLLGDALNGLEKPGEALVVYRQALHVVPRTYEEPTSLYRRISATLQKLHP